MAEDTLDMFATNSMSSIKKYIDDKTQAIT